MTQKLLTIMISILGFSSVSVSAQHIPVAEVLFGADVELCNNGAHVATIYHTLDASSAEKFTSNNLDNVCSEEGTEKATLSGFSRGSNGFIYAAFEEQICDETATEANGGMQVYEGVYRFAPPSLPFGQTATYDYNFVPQNWYYITPNGTKKHVNGSQDDGTLGGGTYIFESVFSSGWEGGKKILYHSEGYAAEKLLLPGGPLSPSSFDYLRVKKYDINARKLISVHQLRSQGTTVDNLFIACTPSGGQCNNCP